jgi:hypothetical protein
MVPGPLGAAPASDGRHNSTPALIIERALAVKHRSETSLPVVTLRGSAALIRVQIIKLGLNGQSVISAGIEFSIGLDVDIKCHRMRPAPWGLWPDDIVNIVITKVCIRRDVV